MDTLEVEYTIMRRMLGGKTVSKPKPIITACKSK